MNEIIEGSPGIWIIDDDQSIRWILDRALTNVGFKVTAFETASTALMQFKRMDAQSRPSLIISDFRMPGINGFEFLKQIKNIDADIPIIIMTAYSDLDSTVDSYQEGAFEYLSKPFDIDDAIDLVTRAYRHTEYHASQSDASPASAPVYSDWKQALQQWADDALARGEAGILTSAVEDVENILVKCALSATKGRKQEAAKRLGWGRNTLTRKLKAQNK